MGLFAGPLSFYGFGFYTPGTRRTRQQSFAAIVTAQLLRHVFVNRTGVGNFFGDAEFVELVDDLARLHFQLPRQFIDSNLTHI